MTQLSWKQLNRTVLARQLLLDRAKLPLHRVVERVAGIQAQYIPSAYVGLWSRVEGFQRGHLDAALERGSVVQGTLLRGTIHLVSRADYWPLAAAIRERMRDWWLRVASTDRSSEEMEDLARRVRVALVDGPKRRADLLSELGIDSTEWGGVGYWVGLVRVPPSGTWDSRRADLYGLAEQWVGPDTADVASGTDLLVRRYLSGFGPAARDDVRAFTGLNLSVIDGSLERLRAREFTAEDGQVLHDMPRARVVDADVPAPVRFLGTWDASLLVHARRSRILPEDFRDQIFHTKAPHSFNTVLVDGQVAGTWRHDGGEISIEQFHPIPRSFRRELGDETGRLATFIS